jgi:hypothetical protein
MKKLLKAIAMVGFLISPCVVSAAYIIHLKDGRDFVTGQYSEEGDQIKFERYGGLIGIRIDLVREIEAIPDPPEKKEIPAVEPEVPAIGPETGNKEKAGEGTAKAEVPKEEGADREKKAMGREQKIPVAVSEEEKKKAEQEKAAEIEMFLEEKRQLMWDIKNATSAFKEAKARNDGEKKNQYWNALLSLQNKLRKLRERVMTKHEGKLPAWWDSAS